MRIRRTSSEILSLLCELESGAETVASFSARHEIPVSTIYAWRRRYEGEERTEGEPAPEFVSVEVEGRAVSDQACVEIEVSDVVIRAPSGFDPEELSGLILRLRRC